MDKPKHRSFKKTMHGMFPSTNAPDLAVCLALSCRLLSCRYPLTALVLGARWI